MSVSYCLINLTKKERISFAHLPVSTKWEITTYSVSAAITTWYLINNSGDQIGFVPDTYGSDDKEWLFKNLTWDQINQFTEITDKIINEMIKEGIIKDNGVEIFDENEPDVYIRKLEVIR